MTAIHLNITSVTQYILIQVIHAFWLVLAYDVLEDRRTIDVTISFYANKVEFIIWNKYNFLQEVSLPAENISTADGTIKVINPWLYLNSSWWPNRSHERTMQIFVLQLQSYQNHSLLKEGWRGNGGGSYCRSNNSDKYN